MKVHEIIKHIENVAPLAVAAPWDNSGMQVAAVQDEVSHVAAMLDPTPLMVAKALDMGADFILSHHPLAMKARMPDTLDEFHAVLRLLFSHDVPLYSAHTSLDANLHGPAAWLAEAFSLSDRRCLEQVAEHPAGEPHYGFGIAGALPAPLSYAAFTEKLSAALGKPAWRASGEKPATVARVAYCPGSGESMIPAAAALRADVYITGDVKYHAALETPIRVLDVGHFILEEAMMRRFAEILRASLEPVRVSFIEADDPFIFEGIA
ncbi:Nif3-like dinuclear metal center hexameric protein [Desulfovibrio sp. OttesenSCG-928-O18]|nr:Nif3-like dinuclear metal center hexameric protein [Desulfovibrio sp. OttesenSCG-928-O18]